MTLEESLEELKIKGSKELKDYSEPPKAILSLGSHIFTYAVEKTALAPQRTLTISHATKQKFRIEKPLLNTLEKVFGRPKIGFTRIYRGRGYSIQFVF